ncbi:zinc finger MYM-type protein 1-like [Centroberyx affinis]|uniref:zinc finger MYM-type protein 1-like n=1 Tax=Centroberyx affinis TaxID=166261 RepID=UPI003A5BA8FD
MIIECFESITTASSFDSTAVREASGFLRMLQDDDFKFFLQLFHQIMPHVDMMYQQLQKKDIDTVLIKRALQSFTSSVQAIRDQSSSQEQQQVATGTTRSNRALGENEKQRLSKEFCDTILAHAKERFSFTNHLVSATLLQGEMFEQHCHTFPVEALNPTIKAYPMLNKAKLKTELSLIYESPEFKGCCGALALYQVIQRYNLQETLYETVALLNILITTPMTTAEAERCFSTLKRIKTFLRNAMGQERLNALAMLSMERELVRNMPDFNERNGMNEPTKTHLDDMGAEMLRLMFGDWPGVCGGRVTAEVKTELEIRSHGKARGPHSAPALHRSCIGLCVLCAQVWYN